MYPTDKDCAARTVLDSLDLPVMVVDEGLRILFANEAGIVVASRPGSSFAIRQDHRAAGRLLSLRRRRDVVALRKLVAAAIDTGAEGTLTLDPDEADRSPGGRCVFFVTPAGPEGPTDARPGPHHRGAALVTIKAPWTRGPPSPELLGILFGFSRAEAEVASSLLGGTTAEDVARARNVGLDTIRTQIRSILAKSESENLRAFENETGALLAMLPRDAAGTRDGRPAGDSVR